MLKEDMAVGLGAPGDGSLFFVLWSGDGRPFKNGVFLLGPEVKSLSGAQVPFALCAMAFGEFEDDYRAYRQVMDAVYDTKLEGVSVRVTPSRGSIRCRVSHGAVEKGFSFARWGETLIRNLTARENIDAARIFFVTSGTADILALRPIASKTGRVIGAMRKMAEELDCDCKSCEYESVCKDAAQLKALRRKLMGQTQA